MFPQEAIAKFADNLYKKLEKVQCNKQKKTERRPPRKDPVKHQLSFDEAVMAVNTNPHRPQEEDSALLRLAVAEASSAAARHGPRDPRPPTAQEALWDSIQLNSSFDCLDDETSSI